jgi:hypothetical protein
MNINDIKNFKSIILLNEMIENGRVFTTIPVGDDKMLEPLFIELMAKGYVSIVNDAFKATADAEKTLDNFKQRYREYLKVFDIYSFVDLEKGEFAFQRYFEFNTDEEWNFYKSQQRFFDVRIAVANFKKMNPYEIVFMSFLNENRFDTTRIGWQMDLLSDAIWAEINDIVATAINISDIGEDAMENMIKSGTEIMMSLIQQEIEFNKKRLEEAKMVPAGEEVVEETIVETTEIIEEYEDDLVYYDPYWDPWYCSPIWLIPLFLW